MPKKINEKKFNIVLILIIFVVVLLCIGIFIKFYNKQNFENIEAKNLENMLKRKGWIKDYEDTLKIRAQTITNEDTEKPVTTVIPVTSAKPVTLPNQPPDFQCPEGVCPGLGKGFYLGKINISDPNQLLQGSDIFKNVNFIKGCEKYRKGGKNTKSVINTDNTESLISSISSENNLQGNFALKAISVKPTIYFNTKYDSTKHNNITTSRLVLSSENGTITFENNDNCRRDNLHPEFLEDFNRLPVKIRNPENPSAWQEFYAFLDKWGSHVMTQITFGSKLEHWESHLDEGTTDIKKLEAKACLEIEGPEPIANSITSSLCSKYDRTKREEASNIRTNNNTVILGGTDVTRDKLLVDGLTDDNIRKFIESSSMSNQAIGYYFTPIWEIYQQVAITKGCINDIDSGLKSSKNCDDLQRCLNLEAAYAYDSVNCEHLKTSNGISYQIFKTNDPESVIKTYECSAAKEGCTHTSTDCHFNLGGCKAYGPSAFEKGDEFGAESGKFRTKVRGDAKDGKNEGINNSCKFSGIKCDCDKMWSGGLPARTLWNQGRS